VCGAGSVRIAYFALVKNIFQPGDIQQFTRIVTSSDTAKFDSGTVHNVYATFALTRDAEWCGRLFVLAMLEPNEEGIGTFVEVQHCAPAFIGNSVLFTATLVSVQNHEIVCNFEASVNDRLIAKGKTGQKILPKEKIERIFSSIQ
jgi:fluoroacetyl-CoA thioesterase